MSNSMISTVLEIEGEAEAVLANAKQEAEKIVADAKRQLEENRKTIGDAAKREIADLEAVAANDRDKKVKELSATGESALSAVKHISDAAYNSGVTHVINALYGK